MRRRLPLVALLAAALAALSLGLAACGDDDDDAAEPPAATTAPATSAPSTTTAPAETTPPAPAGGTVTVDADPSGQLVWVQKTLTAPAGTVTFEINNESSVEHNFEIPDAGVGPSETVTNASTTLEADLQPGTYEYICSVPGHEQAGMVGTLTVE
jgi:uncharacterized cupredoxin-like copper-binding protein